MAKVKETYPVIGMTCASCVKKIESVIARTEGVLNVNANFATEKITVEYDDEKIDVKKLEEVLKSIGYELIS